MAAEKFCNEAIRVAQLLERLGLTPDRPLIDPNESGESGADVVAVIGGKRIGIQETEIDTPQRQEDGGSHDPKVLIGNITRAVEKKSFLRTSGFDELWLLLSACRRALGPVTVPTRLIEVDALNVATSNLLKRSAFDRAFVLTTLFREQTLFEWEAATGQWSKRPGGWPPITREELEELRAITKAKDEA